MSDFTVFWAAALALSLLLYVLLDGFDLGIGMLFPFAPGERSRREMLTAISPVWDGNETWLVVTAAVLFGAFPLVYSIAISAFYLPILLMLASLILRGVAFEFRAKSRRMRRVWDAGFVGGSYLATFMQGTAVGAIVAELPLAADPATGLRFTGGPLFWAQPLALLCGLGLCLGYALMGASWLVGKTEGPSRDFGWRVIPPLLGALMVFLVASLGVSLVKHLQVLHRWIDRPWLVIFPLIGLAGALALVHASRRRLDALPFPATSAIFLAAFGTLAASFLPYMIPFTVTIAQAAAPEASLAFLFWGAGIVVLPLTLAYTLAVYIVFRGKVVVEDEHY